MDDKSQDILSNLRRFWSEYVRIGKFEQSFDNSSRSLTNCTELLASLQSLDPNSQYMGFSPNQFKDMVTMGCAVYIGDMFIGSNPNSSFIINVAPNGLLDEIGIEISGNGVRNRVNLLSMCLKASEDPVTHDLSKKLSPKLEGPR